MLFAPGQDPFSSFGRGYETSIANLMAMERDQRAKDADARSKEQFDYEMGGRRSADDALANVSTTPRFFPENAGAVQQQNLDQLKNFPGGAPADEFGTATAGMQGQAMRRPQTLEEMKIDPGAAIWLNQVHPGALKMLGVISPGEQQAQQKTQAARVGIKQAMQSGDFSPAGLAKIGSYIADDPSLSHMLPIITEIAKTSQEDPQGTELGLKAYWAARNAPGGSHAAGEQAMTTMGAKMKPATMTKLITAVKAFAPAAPAHYAAGTQVEQPDGSFKPVGSVPQHVDVVIGEAMAKYGRGEKLSDQEQKMVDSKLAAIGAPGVNAETNKVRADAYVSHLQTVTKNLNREVQSYETQMTNGKLDETGKAKAIDSYDRAIKTLEAETMNGTVPQGRERDHQRQINDLETKRSKMFSYQPGAASPQGGPAKSSGGKMRSATDFLGKIGL